MAMLFIPILILLLNDHLQLASAAGDKLTSSDSISGNQTIVSATSIFKLGFFSPSNSAHKYVGIWYSNSPETVVWVANRETPLTDSSAVITIGNDGNIVVKRSNTRNGSIVWSSNVSSAYNSTVAVLSDSGNLVLNGADGIQIWQSFDHPTDTYLPGMKMWWNLRTSTTGQITSWKDSEDPSPGSYSFGFNPYAPLELVIWNDSVPNWRSYVWIANSSSVLFPSYSPKMVLRLEANGSSDIFMTYSPLDGSTLLRWLLDSTGALRMLFWTEQLKSWTQFHSPGTNPCTARYNFCGPYGSCTVHGDYQVCGCLPDFVPRFQRDWDAGKYSGGCMRRTPMTCDKMEPKFLKLERMKLPKNMVLIKNASQAQCISECTDRCNCTAYSFLNLSSVVSSSRCLIWDGDLIDLVQDAYGDILNLRHDASELVSSTQIDEPSKKKNALAIILTVLTGSIIFFGIFGFYLMKRIKGRGNFNLEVVSLARQRDKKGMTELPMIDFILILNATDNFAPANKLGEGGFGPVYKGMLGCQEIAVKRLSKSSNQGSEEFKNEVELIAKLQHTNLVKLLGWCMHENERILVSEYLPNKSLDKYIFDTKQSVKLDWATHFRIIEGISQAILYLHRYSRLRVIHRDLKTSNILLDEAMSPKISDFGLARIFEGNQTEAKTERVVGTYGYMPPEYALNGLFSEKTDVFSFGVILLEIMTGKRSTGFYPHSESLNLLEYVWQFWDEDRRLELADPSVCGQFQVSEFVKCIQVSLLCVQERMEDRPTMASVVTMLGNENSNLPPPKKPAFAMGRDANSVNGSPFYEPIDSVNKLTITSINGAKISVCKR